MNKWREFAELNNMTTEDFENEVIDAAQAVLAMHLDKSGGDEVTITNSQHDGVYQLVFKRIVK